MVAVGIKKNGKTTRDVSWSITAGVPDHDLLDLKLSEDQKISFSLFLKLFGSLSLSFPFFCFVSFSWCFSLLKKIK